MRSCSVIQYFYESALAHFCQTPFAKQKSQNPSPLHELIMTRILTVEPFGDFFGKTITASAVRLKGKWLQRAGFLPGQQVSLKIVGQGAIELRVQTPSETPVQTAEQTK